MGIFDGLTWTWRAGLVVAVALLGLTPRASEAGPTAAPLGPGAAALLMGGTVGEPEIAMWADLASDPDPLARATAARLGAVSGAHSLTAPLMAALEKETDLVAAREQIRALALLAGPGVDDALFRAASRFSGMLDPTLAVGIASRGSLAIALVPRLSQLRLYPSGWKSVAAWMTANAEKPLDPLAAAVLLARNEAAWMGLLWLAEEERKPLDDATLTTALAKGDEAIRERTYWHLLRAGRPAAGEKSSLAEALAATPEARGEGGPVARLAYELVARQLGRPAQGQSELIRSLDEQAALQLPMDALALRQLRGDEVQAYGLIRFSEKNAVADRLKILGKTKHAVPAVAAPVSSMRTLSDLVPRLPDAVLGAAGCRIDGMRWALLEIHHDATGRRESLGVAIPPDLGPECQKAVRALLLTALVLPERPARAKQTDVLLLPLSPEFFACVGGQRPSAEAPWSIGGRITEPRKTRNASPIYPRAAVNERKQGVVVLEATISAQGCVSGAEVLRSVDARLDSAALGAVVQWEYTPTLLNGVPVPVLMTVTVNFKLN